MRYCILDLETDGYTTYGRFCNPLDPNHKIIISSIKYYDQEEVELIYNEDCYEEGILPGEALGSILERCDIIVGQNVKFDMLWLWDYAPLQQWVENGGIIFDTLTAQYLLDGQDPYIPRGLDSLATKYGAELKNDIIGKLYKGSFTKNEAKENAMAALKAKWGKNIPYKQYWRYKRFKTRDDEWRSKRHKSFKYLVERGGVDAMCDYQDHIDYKDDQRMLDLIDKALLQKGLLSSEIPSDILLPYAEGDARNTEIVFLAQLQEIGRMNMGPLVDSYMRHYIALIEMEYNGLHVNQQLAEEETVRYTEKLALEKQHLRDIALGALQWPTADFSPGSSEDVSIILFGPPEARMEEFTLCTPFNVNSSIVTPKKAKKTGYYSVDSETLTTIVDSEEAPPELRAFCSGVLEFRKTQKILSTYLQLPHKNAAGEVTSIKGNLALVHPDGKLHPEFQSANTVTGRLSSRNPNGQNFPKYAKTMIKSRFPGGKIISADFGQLEIALAPIITGAKLLETELNNDLDMHCKNWCFISGDDYETFIASKDTDPDYKKKRDRGKVLTYAQAYGAGTGKLALDLDVTYEEMEAIEARKDLDYPELEAFNEWLTGYLNKNSVATTIRIPPKVKLPNNGGVYFDEENKVFRTKAKYQSPLGKIYTYYSFITKYQKWNPRAKQMEPAEFVYYKSTDIKNWKIQGYGADVVGTQVGELFKHIYKHRKTVKMMCEIHDDITFDVAPESVDLVIHLISAILPNIRDTFKKYFNVEITVPIKVDISVGDSWGTQEEIKSVVFRPTQTPMEIREG